MLILKLTKQHYFIYDVAKWYFPTKHFQDFQAERKASDLIRDFTTVHSLLRLGVALRHEVRNQFEN